MSVAHLIPPPPPPPLAPPPMLGEFQHSMGAMLGGVLAALALWGIACAQTYEYFVDYGGTDSRFQRSIVAILWIIDTIGTATNSHRLYYYLIVNFGDPAAMSKPVWSSNIQPLITGLSCFIIRAMYSRRVYTLSKKKISLVIWIMCVSLCDLVICLLEMACSYYKNAFRDWKFVQRLPFVTFSLNIVAEASIVIALCWYLHSSKTGFRNMDSLVNFLMVYVVNTGFLVLLDATVGVILFVRMPKSMVSVVFFMLLSKLYLNAYLGSLNVRGRLRERKTELSFHVANTDSESQSDFLSTRHNKGNSISMNDRTSKPAIEINLERSVERRVDESS